jgi:hypothetical protein
MRRVLLLLSLVVLCLAFAPAPLPRPQGRTKPSAPVRRFAHVRLRNETVAGVVEEVRRMLGPGGYVTGEPITNSLLLEGDAGDVDRALAAIEGRGW